MERGTARIVIPGARPPSWNTLWSQKHWSDRKAIKDEHSLVMRGAIDPDEAFMFDVPVHITWTAYIKGRAMDTSNLCIKPYEDALIGWYIEDDSIEFVPKTSLVVVRDSDNPRLVVEIEPYVLESN